MYDLEERTKKFGKNMVEYLREIPLIVVAKPLVSQCIRSATSLGANYCEANNASSKKDFKNKIFICRKETQETKYWIEMLAQACPQQKEKLRVLWKEAHELSLIFNKISSTLRKDEK